MSKNITPAKSSINFKPVKNNSKVHNERLGELDYVYSELTPNNESWKLKEISEAKVEIMDLYRSTIGQKMQEQSVPIKEAVVNIKPDTTMDDLKTLANKLENKYGMQCFQIFIHRDEGFSKDKLNHHAHMVFDFQHKTNRTPEGKMQVDKKGNAILYKRGPNKGLQKPVPSTLAKTVKPNRGDMSEIQDLTAEVLKMERGERRENTNIVRLEAVEFKAKEEQIRTNKIIEKNSKLQVVNEQLEQKKNDLEREYRRLVEENREFERVEAEIRADWEGVTREHERLKTREQSLNGEITKLREGIAKDRKGHREFAFGILRERAEIIRDQRRYKKRIIQLERRIDREGREIGELERNKSFLESRYQDLRRENLERDSEQDRRYRAISEELIQSPEGYNKFSEEEINGAIQWLKRYVESAEEEYERTEEEYQRQRVAVEALKAGRKA